MKVLFLCARNQWRSPTAQRVWRGRLQTRSAGVTRSARKRVSQRDLDWADLVCVMEHDHLDRLRQDYPSSCAALEERGALHVLDIPDVHRFMEPALIEELERSVQAVLDGLTGPEGAR